MAALYLGQVVDVIKLATNKERKGFIKDSQIVTALRIGSWNYFQKQLEKYRAGEEVPSTLRPFKKSALSSLAISTYADSSAAFAFVPDLIKEISFIFPASSGSTAPNTGQFLSQSEWDDRRSSSLFPPTLNDPIAKMEQTGIYVLPNVGVQIVISYIRRPVDFVYATTVDADGHGTTYNAAASTDMEFSQECYPDIIKEALIVLGIKNQDQQVIQFGASVKD